MRLWDLRTAICQGVLHVPGNPTANFDQQVGGLCVERVWKRVTRGWLHPRVGWALSGWVDG